MHLISCLGAASALANLAFAIPAEYSPLEKRGAAFTVHQTVAKRFVLSGPASVAKVYAKYGKSMPATVRAAAANNNGTVVASPEEYDSEYLCPVNLGGQTLNLDLDTGSSDLWVFSSQLPSSAQTGHSVYSPSKSTTAKVNTGQTWQISYGDGSTASGNVYFDIVKVGATTVTSQAVELAQTISPQFEADVDNDGILGLAMDSLNQVYPDLVRTFFSNAIPTLASPLFTANLKKGKPGNFNFGYINKSEYTGSITYVPITTVNGFWEFNSSGYAIGNSAFVSASIDGIADTGTTVVYLPPAIVSAYYTKVSGAKYVSTQGGYTFPCSATTPSLTLGIGSYKAVIPGSYLNYAPATPTTCFGGIQRNTGIGFSIFGDILLKSQFVVFDMSNPPRIGFAAKPP